MAQEASTGEGHKDGATSEANPVVLRIAEVENQLRTTIAEVSESGFNAKDFLRSVAARPAATASIGAFSANSISEDPKAKLTQLFNEYRSLHKVHTPGVEEAALVDKLLATTEEDTDSRASKPSREESKNEKDDSDKKAESPEDLKKKQQDAQKAARLNQTVRDLEQNLARKQQEDLARQEARRANGGGGSGGGGNGGGGQGDGGGSGGDSSGRGFNNSNNNQNQFSNDSLDRFANKIGNAVGQQNFPSSSSINSRKDDEKKSNFSIEPSKASTNPFSTENKDKLSAANLSNKASNLNLPEVSASTKVWTGTPQPMSSSQWGSAGGGIASAAPAAASPAQNGNMMGGPQRMMGMGGNSGAVGGFGSDDSFPFSVTGEPGGESEDDGWPWFQVVSVPMSSSGGEGGMSEISSAGSDSGSTTESGAPKAIKGVPQYLYLLNRDEQSLRGIPGIFRGLAAGYRKTRVQNLCSQGENQKVGICQRFKNSLKNNNDQDLEG